MDRITEVTRDFIDALIQLRRVEPAALPAPAALHQRLRRSVDELFTKAAQAGYAREDANDVAYAAVALADEIAISRTEAYREYWSGQSLQLQYFRENVAGEGFFTRLKALRADPRRRDVLQVYYLALQLGFQGRYQVRGGEVELLRLTEEVQHDLERGRRHDAEVLSPQGARPEQARAAAGGPPVLLWAGVGVLGLLLLVYLGLYLWGGAGTGRVLERIAAAKLT